MKVDGVTAVYPFGDDAKVTVLTKKSDGLSEESVKKLLEGSKEFKLKSFPKKA
jgi:hypothetical protein